MITPLVFGDLFTYESREYIYLAKTEEIVYAAQILPVTDTNRVNKFYESKVIKGKEDKIAKHPLFCFVMLKTSKFKDRCAHFARTGLDDFSFFIEKLSVVLDKDDLMQVLNTIKSDSPVPMQLKELVKDIRL